jgi:hypothetical protein
LGRRAAFWERAAFGYDPELEDRFREEMNTAATQHQQVAEIASDPG